MTAPPSRARFAALAFRDFRYLWFGVIAMTAGMQMQVIVRGYFVYDLTSSPLILGLVSTGFAVPMLVLALFGGELADRLPKRRIIQLCQGTGSITALVIAVSITTGTVAWPHLFAASIVTGVIFAFMVPSRTALIPQIVCEKNAANAFALNAAAMSTTTLLAPALAGNLYVLIGADGVYYCIAALQAGAVLLTGMVRAPERPPSHPREAVMHEIAAGLRYIRENGIIVLLIVTAMTTALLALPFRSLLPIYIVEVFGRGPEALGLLVTLMGLGAIGGAVIIAGFGTRKRGPTLLVGGFLSAASLLVASARASFVVVGLCMIVLGVGDAFRRSLAMALIMEHTERKYQGRVSSVYTMNFGLMPLGTLPASILTEYLGVRFATATLGALLLGICTYLTVAKKSLRKLE